LPLKIIGVASIGLMVRAWWAKRQRQYMVSRIAAEQIKSYNPSARILVMLRNPIDVMHALHSKRLFMNMEHITDFGKGDHLR
jgi:hypothetical protein